ncbi:unnamed protein product [Moneuplotes crassus]|uniref:Uncharacterized protein n=1 Tax=Euplotes crassus TaxID=5936 RepID=A0AAD1U4N3_EUPCR|nr:unnamed protein product [Moneuplotes crassus]
MNSTDHGKEVEDEILEYLNREANSWLDLEKLTESIEKSVNSTIDKEEAGKNLTRRISNMIKEAELQMREPGNNTRNSMIKIPDTSDILEKSLGILESSQRKSANDSQHLNPSVGSHRRHKKSIIQTTSNNSDRIIEDEWSKSIQAQTKEQYETPERMGIRKTIGIMKPPDVSRETMVYDNKDYNLDRLISDNFGISLEQIEKSDSFSMRNHPIKESISDIFRSLSDLKVKEEVKENQDLMNIWKYFEKITELSAILNKIKERNHNNQPTRREIRRREQDNSPFTLISEDGKIGSGIRTNYFLEFGNIPIGLFESGVLQFRIKTDEEPPKKPPKGKCTYPNCFRCKYTVMSNYSGYHLLHFSEDDTITICGMIHRTMLIGCVIPDDIDSRVKCGLIDIRFLDFSSLQDFPSGIRKYKIPAWNLFGISKEKDLSELKRIYSHDNKTDFQIECPPSKVCKVQAIAKVIADFNPQNTESPIEFSFLEDEEIGLIDDDNEEIKLLSVRKNFIICIISLPNLSGWLEAYSALDENCRVGIIHKDFISLMGED